MKNVIATLILCAAPAYSADQIKLFKAPPKRDWEKRYKTKKDQRNKNYLKNRKR